MRKRNSLMLLALPLLPVLTACDSDGLTEGDPNYFTSSRGQLTAVTETGDTLYLLPGQAAGTAMLTFDGRTRQVNAAQNAVNVTTYSGDMALPESITATNGHTYTLTAIGEQALMGCRSLTSITVPATVQTLGDGAFAICQELTAVALPEGITAIPYGCFGNCKKLASITLPQSVTHIGELAFYGCAKLTAYHFQSQTPPAIDGGLYLPEGVEVAVYVPASAVAAYEADEAFSAVTIYADSVLINN